MACHSPPALPAPADMSSFAGLNMYQQQPADPSKAQAQPQQPQQPAMNLAGYSAVRPHALPFADMNPFFSLPLNETSSVTFS